MTKDEVIEGLKCHKLGSLSLCSVCPYFKDDFCDVSLTKDAIKLLDKLPIESIMEQYEKLIPENQAIKKIGDAVLELADFLT